MRPRPYWVMMTTNADRLISEVFQTLGQQAITKRYQALLMALEACVRQWDDLSALDLIDGDPNAVGSAQTRASTLRSCGDTIGDLVRLHRDPTYNP